MKKNNNKQAGIYSFLVPYLEAGNEEAINAARERHIREYKANWRRNKRKEQHRIDLLFTNGEWSLIKKAALKHNRSATKYCKEAILAYTNKAYIVRDTVNYKLIQEVLYMIYAKLKNNVDGSESLIPGLNYLMSTVQAIERIIVQELLMPQTLEDKIIEVIATDNAYKNIIQKILDSM